MNDTAITALLMIYGIGLWALHDLVLVPRWKRRHRSPKR